MTLDISGDDTAAFPDTGEDHLRLACIVLQDLVGHPAQFLFCRGLREDIVLHSATKLGILTKSLILAPSINFSYGPFPGDRVHFGRYRSHHPVREEYPADPQ